MGIISSAVFVGIFTGVLIGGKISDLYGRKALLNRIPVFIYLFGIVIPFT